MSRKRKPGQRPIRESCPLPETLQCGHISECPSRGQIELVLRNANDNGEEPIIVRLEIPACMAVTKDRVKDYLSRAFRAAIPGDPDPDWHTAMICVLSDPSKVAQFGMSISRSDPLFILGAAMDAPVGAYGG